MCSNASGKQAFSVSTVYTTQAYKTGSSIQKTTDPLNEYH